MNQHLIFLILSLKKTLLFTIILISCTLSAQTFRNLGLHTQVDHVQPMTGIVFWTDNGSDLNTLGDKVQLTFSYLVYADIVSQENVYDWSVVDDLLEDAANQGRQVILRFRYTYPGETTPSVPQYIRNRGDYTDQIMNVEGSSTYIPDWSNQELQDFTMEFFTNFANRYDTDERVAFLQIGFGSYSEYHLYDGPFQFGQTFPTKAYQTTFLQHVDAVFNETQWAISIDAADGSHTPISSNNTLKNLNYGLFDDSFLHEEHSENDNEYNRASWLLFGENRANTNVAGGELNYYSNYDQEHVLDTPNGPWGTSFEELAALYDISYMIGNDQLNYQSSARIEEAGMNIGYHYEVTQFRTNGTITEVTITNTGLAPIYYDAYPTVAGIRSTESLKGLTSGQSRSFTINTNAESESLTITSDRLVTGQEIQFDADLDESILSVTEVFVDDTSVISYPNPFKDELTITLKNTTPVQVSIFNILGSSIFQQEVITDDYTIDTSRFKTGIYILKTESAHNSSIQTIIKQ
ncbi:DUF4832 domain-containing protein [Aquimarina addita]|uniref:DUF4832 domain-containing protein n=1 Tax=Aquimarina addita TaxID=870485 RepID=A0ABP7XC15_9FLAO